jgi:hypothetical protein
MQRKLKKNLLNTRPPNIRPVILSRQQIAEKAIDLFKQRYCNIWPEHSGGETRLVGYNNITGQFIGAIVLSTNEIISKAQIEFIAAVMKPGCLGYIITQSNTCGKIEIKVWTPDIIQSTFIER